MKKKKKKYIPEKAKAVIKAYRSVDLTVPPSDVMGSWTGVPLDGPEPVQDADDL